MSKLTVQLKGSLLCIALSISVSGCAKDRSLSPPLDGEKVTFTIKAPAELKPYAMRVMYRSAKCQRVSHDASGRPEMLDGHSSFETVFQRGRSENIYEATLSVNGGGPCEWRLSNVMFGVTYREPSRFGENVLAGGGGGVIVVFDHNNPQLRVGGAARVEGSQLRIVKDYYLWVNERYTGGYVKRASLSGYGGGYLTYEARQARNVYFEPVFHPEFVVTSVAPKKHAVGDFIKFFYPDGTVESDPEGRPNFKKMQEIRLRAEAKK
jgi:hypothetical protein